MANRSSYAASKHALVGFFDSLRAEQARRGVGVLNIFPGYVRTRFVNTCGERKIGILDSFRWS